MYCVKNFIDVRNDFSIQFCNDVVEPQVYTSDHLNFDIPRIGIPTVCSNSFVKFFKIYLSNSIIPFKKYDNILAKIHFNLHTLNQEENVRSVNIIEGPACLMKTTMMNLCKGKTNDLMEYLSSNEILLDDKDMGKHMEWIIQNFLKYKETVVFDRDVTSILGYDVITFMLNKLFNLKYDEFLRILSSSVDQTAYNYTNEILDVIYKANEMSFKHYFGLLTNVQLYFKIKTNVILLSPFKNEFDENDFNIYFERYMKRIENYKNSNELDENTLRCLSFYSKDKYELFLYICVQEYIFRKMYTLGYSSIKYISNFKDVTNIVEELNKTK